MPDNTADDNSASAAAPAASDNSATTATGEEEDDVELTLDAVHDELEMTLSNAKKQTRSAATYYKHNLENIRFLLWAYENQDVESIGDALDPSFVAALDATKANIQYPTKFSRYKGQELQKKQDNFLTKALRDEIKDRLGTPGHKPPHPTLLHDELTPDQFGEYLCHKKKEGGETLKPDTYKNFRSGLSYLYRRYGQKMDIEKFEEGRSAATPGGGTGGATYNMFLHRSDGKLRRVPPNWPFPKGSLLNVYQYWHWGDEVNHVHPIKNLQRKDLEWSNERHLKDLEEVSFLCGKIDEEAKRKGILATNSDRVATTSIYYDCVGVLGVPRYTPQNKKRNMAKIAWSSVLKLMPAENRKRPTKDAGSNRNKRRRRNRSGGNSASSSALGVGTGTGSRNSGGAGAAGSRSNSGGAGSRNSSAAVDSDTEFMMAMVDMTTADVIQARTDGLDAAMAERHQEMEMDSLAEARGEAGHHDGDGNAIGIAQRRPGISAADAGYREQLDRAI